MKKYYTISSTIIFMIVTIIYLGTLFPHAFFLSIFLSYVLSIPLFITVLGMFNTIKNRVLDKKTRYLITFTNDTKEVYFINTDTKPEHFVITEKNMGKTIFILNVYKYQI